VINSETKAKPNKQEKPQDDHNACGFFASDDGIRLRPMATADMDEIMAIERSAYRFPWSERFFLQELQVPCARSILAEIDGCITGYVLFWLLPGVIDIHNVAVHLNFRRRGIARLLLGKVLAQAKVQSVTRVTLEVRKSNSAAKKLYESIGFLVTGTRQGYYSDDGEDALTMTLELP
jgi:[ribosomal protein S18]-alanine N-acetyltransferase